MIYETNKRNAPGAKISSRMDFSRPDAAGAARLNRVLWQGPEGLRAHAQAEAHRLSRWRREIPGMNPLKISADQFRHLAERVTATRSGISRKCGLGSRGTDQTSGAETLRLIRFGSARARNRRSSFQQLA